MILYILYLTAKSWSIKASFLTIAASNVQWLGGAVEPVPLTSVASNVKWLVELSDRWNSSISFSGKSQQTSQFMVKKHSGLPVRIWSRKWYIPPAVPRAVYSCKYLKNREGCEPSSTGQYFWIGCQTCRRQQNQNKMWKEYCSIGIQWIFRTEHEIKADSTKHAAPADGRIGLQVGIHSSLLFYTSPYQDF